MAASLKQKSSRNIIFGRRERKIRVCASFIGYIRQFWRFPLNVIEPSVVRGGANNQAVRVVCNQEVRASRRHLCRLWHHSNVTSASALDGGRGNTQPDNSTDLLCGFHCDKGERKRVQKPRTFADVPCDWSPLPPPSSSCCANFQVPIPMPRTELSTME